MPILVCANHKGGVCKTTTAVNLAAGLALAGYSTCLVDCDPQANATLSTNYQLEISTCLADAVIKFDGRPLVPIEDAIYQTAVENLDLVPSRLSLEEIHSQVLGAVPRLTKAIRTLGARYEVVVIDTPPSLGPLFIGPLQEATHVIIPVTPSILSLDGLVALVSAIRDVRTGRDDGNPRILGTLLSAYDSRNSIGQHTAEVLAADPELGPVLFNSRISINTRLADTPGEHLPVYCSSWRGPSLDKAIAQFDELVAEVIDRLQLKSGRKNLRAVKRGAK